jgi:hypothetical protein
MNHSLAPKTTNGRLCVVPVGWQRDENGKWVYTKRRKRVQQARKQEEARNTQKPQKDNKRCLIS